MKILKINEDALIALTLEEQVLVALEYWRQYRTYFHRGQIGEYPNQRFAEL